MYWICEEDLLPSGRQGVRGPLRLEGVNTWSVASILLHRFTTYKFRSSSFALPSPLPQILFFAFVFASSLPPCPDGAMASSDLIRRALRVSWQGVADGARGESAQRGVPFVPDPSPGPALRSGVRSASELVHGDGDIMARAAAIARLDSGSNGGRVLPSPGVRSSPRLAASLSARAATGPDSLGASRPVSMAFSVRSVARWGGRSAAGRPVVSGGRCDARRRRPHAARGLASGRSSVGRAREAQRGRRSPHVPAASSACGRGACSPAHDFPGGGGGAGARPRHLYTVCTCACDTLNPCTFEHLALPMCTYVCS